MSLLVLDPDAAAAETLQDQLVDLGYETLVTSDNRVGVDLCSGGGVELLICCSVDALVQLEGLTPTVSLVLALATPMTLTTVLDSLQHNVNDCWELPLSDADLISKTRSLLTRRREMLQRINSDAYDMRAELERDQRAGQYIQMGILPPNPMGIRHYRLRHRVEPSLVLSGDFVDYFQISERYFACYVADVAGHGASSAFVTVLLKNFSRRLRREYRNSMLRNPGEILAWINAELIDQGIEKHVAMFLAVVDMRQDLLRYANAAHLPPAMLVVNGTLQSLEQRAKPLGLFADADYASQTADFPSGARLVVFSDGVLDLVPRPSLAEKESYLAQAVKTCTTLDELWSKLDRNRMGPDDVSCLLVNHVV